MSASRLKSVVFCLLGAAVCAVLAWQIRFALAQPRGSFSVSFVDFTNSASGAVSAIFSASNGYPRDVVFAAGAVQIRQPKGWLPVSVYGHPAGPVFRVAPNGARVFAMPLPKVDGLVWRVPLHYETVDTTIDLWTRRAKAALGLAGAVKPSMSTNTPKMLGVSTNMVESAGTRRLLQETNYAP
jgi:hypothetical protein